MVWDRERFDRMPEQEWELFLEETRRAPRLAQRVEKIIRDGKGFPEPCDLYDRCWECPNFKDCFGIQANPGIARCLSPGILHIEFDSWNRNLGGFRDSIRILYQP